MEVETLMRANEVILYPPLSDFVIDSAERAESGPLDVSDDVSSEVCLLCCAVIAVRAAVRSLTAVHLLVPAPKKQH